MVVKNCYQFLEDVPEMDFIANGDIAEILRIYKFMNGTGSVLQKPSCVSRIIKKRRSVRVCCWIP